ncbi:MAG: MATE family efflux transporter [Clostridiales bacterium]|nr:MATE family efflux transporter [Clostridiales bacterium]
MKKKSLDLTQGNALKLIIQFALPILLSQFLQNLYNSADSIIAGNYVGVTALAAVSSSADISHLLIGFFAGVSSGAGVVFARYFGAKDYKNLHTAIHTTLCFAIILGLVLAAAGILLTPLLLRVVACPEDVWDEAALYLRIYFIGVLFSAMYNVASGVLRAVGNSRDPFRYLAITCGVNIVLDLIAVAWLRMGVAGLALATIGAQLLSVALILRDMLRTTDVYRLNPRELHIDKPTLLTVLDLSLPAGVQFAIISISNLFVQRYVNLFGSAAMAGIGAAKKIDRYVGIISNSIGSSSATFISQNLGANQNDRAFRGLRVCLMICGGAVLLMGVPTYFFAPVVIRVFTTNPEAMAYGVAMVRVMMPLFYLQSLSQVFTNAVRGFGKARAVMVLSLLGMVGCRQLFLNISMRLNFTVYNVFYAYPIGWGCGSLFIILYFLICVRPYYRGDRAPHVHGR